MSDDGEFCVTGQVTERCKDNCSKFQVLKDDEIQWGDQPFELAEGNPRNL